MRSAIHVIRRIHVLDCSEHFSGGGEHGARRLIVCVVCLYRSSALPTGYRLLARASSPFATHCPISLIRPTCSSASSWPRVPTCWRRLLRRGTCGHLGRSVLMASPCLRQRWGAARSDGAAARKFPHTVTHTPWGYRSPRGFVGAANGVWIDVCRIPTQTLGVANPHPLRIR